VAILKKLFLIALFILMTGYLHAAPELSYFTVSMGKVDYDKLQIAPLLKIIQKNSKDAEAMHFLAIKYSKKNDKSSSEKYFLKSLNLRPDDSLILHNYGVFLANAKQNYQKARIYLEKAYVGYSGDRFLKAVFYRDLIDLLSELRETEKILALHKEYIALIQGSNPDMAAMCNYFFDSYSRLFDHFTAIKQIGRFESYGNIFVQACPGDGRSYHLLYNTLPMEGNETRKKELIQKAYQLLPEHDQIKNNYAFFLLFTNPDQPEIPIKLFKEVNAKNKNYFFAPYNLGWAYYHHDKFEESEHWYEIAYQLNPNYPNLVYEIEDLHTAWCEKLFSDKDYQTAQMIVNRFIKKHPENPWALFLAARIHIKLNNKTLALNLIKKSIELDGTIRNAISKEKDFDVFGEDPEFKKLMIGSYGEQG